MTALVSKSSRYVTHRTAGAAWLLVYVAMATVDAAAFASRPASVPTTYTIAGWENFPPVDFLGPTGALEGFTRDLSTAVVRTLGGGARYVHSPDWEQLQQWIDSGTVDLIQDVAAIPEREDIFDFTEPLLEMPEVIFVRANEIAIHDLTSLNDDAVACVSQRASHLYLQQFPRIRLHPVKTPDEALQLLLAGDIDAFVCPEPVGTFLIQQLGYGRQIKISGAPLRTLRWSMAVKRGNAELLSRLNQGIRSVRASGEYDAIYKNWFGRDILVGYTEREVRLIIVFAVGLTVLTAFVVGLFLFNRRLRRSRNELMQTVDELVAAEKKIREQSQLLEYVFQYALESVVILDRNFNFIRVNNTYAQADQRDPSEFPGHNHFELYPSDAKPIFEDVVATKKPISFKARPFDYPDHPERGISYWDWTLAPILDSLGEVESLVFNLHDVTEVKRAELALQESEQRFRSTFELAAVGIAHVSLDGAFLRVNDKLCATVGYDRSDLVQKTLPQITHPDDLELDQALMQQVLENRITTYTIEKRYLHKNGSVVWVELTVSLVRAEDDSPKYFIAVVSDILDRKEIEAALRERETNFRALAKNASDGILIISDAGEHCYANERAAEMTGWTLSRLSTSRLSELLPDEEAVAILQWCQSPTSTVAAPTPFQVSLGARNGATTFIELTSARTIWKGQRASVLMLRDITERKRAEEQIKASLAEKDVLLKEIFHRVKNNLQVVSSLLDLQSNQVKDPRALELFRESQNRVRSMALIHEKLYNSGNLGKIDFGDYIETLVSSLARSYAVRACSVQVAVEVDDVSLNLDTAIPCGLIINELVSNAFKHAFPDGEPMADDPQVTVVLRPESEDVYALTVTDNGVGFPSTVDFRNTQSLGLQLITTLTQQLEGVIELRTEGGAAFEIRFSELNYKSRL